MSNEFLEANKLIIEEGTLLHNMFRIGSGSLTSFEIAFNLRSVETDPEWAQKGLKTRNYQCVQWARKENVKEVLEAAKKDYPFGFSTKVSWRQKDEWFEKWFGGNK